MPALEKHVSALTNRILTSMDNRSAEKKTNKTN
jgi:hypothetical protein